MPEIIGLHTYKPLFSGAEDNRFLTAPAVGISMGYALFSYQISLFGDLFIDAAIGIEHELTGEVGYVCRETAVIIYWRIHLQIVFQGSFEIFATVTGRGVHAACA